MSLAGVHRLWCRPGLAVGGSAHEHIAVEASLESRLLSNETKESLAPIPDHERGHRLAVRFQPIGVLGISEDKQVEAGEALPREGSSIRLVLHRHNGRSAAYRRRGRTRGR